jgi:hypothetical protein
VFKQTVYALYCVLWAETTDFLLIFVLFYLVLRKYVDQFTLVFVKVAMKINFEQSKIQEDFKFPGCSLTSLELTRVDELNLNAILMIGAGCARLQRLTIAYCHYTVEDNDRRRLEAAVEAARGCMHRRFIIKKTWLSAFSYAQSRLSLFFCRSLGFLVSWFSSLIYKMVWQILCVMYVEKVWGGGDFVCLFAKTIFHCH